MQTTNHPGGILDERQLLRVFEAKQLIERFKKSELSIRAFAARAGIPESTLRSILRRSKSGLNGLIDHRQSNGRRSEVDSLCLTWVLAFTATHRRTTLTAAWRALEPIAKSEGWSFPSYGMLLRAVTKLPPDAREMMIHGSKHLFEKWGLVQRKEHTAPNACWQIDATQIGVWILDPVSGELFQPWAIGIIDCATRIVMRLHLVRTSPTTSDLLLALRTAILPTEDDRFPFLGVPNTVQTDNGSIFKSADFLDALLRLGVQAKRIENDCPSSNGKIERFFRTLGDQLLRHLDGYAHQHRGLQAAKANPLPWPILPRLTEKFLADYHLREHRSLGKSPYEAWLDGLCDAHGLSFLANDVVEACKVRVEKTVNRDGIEIGPGRHLTAPELAGLVRQRVTLRLRPEGGDTEADCFHDGRLIARLHQIEGNSKLAEQLGSARLVRAKELARLRKALIREARRILPEHPSKLTGRKDDKVIPMSNGEDWEKEWNGEEDLTIPELPDESEDEA